MTTIAIITSHAPSLANFRGPLIKQLSEMGICVLALAPNYDEITRAEVTGLGAVAVSFKMNRVGMNPLQDVIDTFRLSWLLLRLRPDVSLGHFVKPAIFGTFAAWMAGVPRRIAMVEGLGIVFTLTSDKLAFRRKILQKVVIKLYQLALSRAHQTIFLNPDDKAEFIEYRILSDEKAFLLGGIGVDLDMWLATPPLENPVTFLLVARLLREKGIVEFARAARLVKLIHPESRFILLGGLDDAPNALTRAEIEQWEKDGILEWKGHLSVQPWLEKISVFVLPSYYREGVPRSTQEAMAKGRAVITTDAPGCRETVVDGVNGFLVPIRDADSLAKKMIEFIDNPGLISSMGQASRSLAEERFDVRKVNSRLIDLLFTPSDV